MFPLMHHDFLSKLFLVFCIVSFLIPLGDLAAQDDLQQQFQDSVEELRSAIKEAKFLGAKYYHSPADEAEEWEAKWVKAGERGAVAAEKMKASAIGLLLKKADPDPKIVTLCHSIARKLFDEGDYEYAFEVAKRLVELDPRESSYDVLLARAAVMTNRFEIVKEFVDYDPDELSQIPKKELETFKNVAELKQDYDRELELRAQEQQAGDLPQVELETTCGKIVIELFENQAPQTVGNFINLVESGFYDGILFHRVLKGFMAQAGSFTMRGPQSMSYTIYDEFDTDEARHHFRGSVSMATIPGVPNSGSSQFFICFAPQTMLDGHHTVFGRVISDMKVLDDLAITVKTDAEGQEELLEDVMPDQIKSARVLRKRDHEYEPVRVKK